MNLEKDGGWDKDLGVIMCGESFSFHMYMYTYVCIWM